MDWIVRGRSLLGIFLFLGIAWLFSERRKKVRPWVVTWGVGLQLILAAVFVWLPGSRWIFQQLNAAVRILGEATKAGTSFVFGYAGGGKPPFLLDSAAIKDGASTVILAFQLLPLVLVVSALTALLFHWGVLQRIIRGISAGLQKTMKVSGCESLATAANVFVGMVEAPMFIRPYIRTLTRSELFAVMTGGMATIAGTVLVLYASFLQTALPGALGHLLVASLISAPAALLVAKIMIPEVDTPRSGAFQVEVETKTSMGAISHGTLQGLKLLLNIIAMLIVFVALVHLVNAFLGIFGKVDGRPLSLQRILGWLMAPLTYAMGVPWKEAATAGALMGTKTVLNELLAYLDLAKLPAEALGLRGRLIMTYALCGFANFGSLGIMIGGLGGMCPERREEIAQLGLRAIVAGTIATCLTGCVIGILAA